MTFTIDSNILIFLQRNQPPDVFPTIWKWLATQLHHGELCVCPNVLEELNRQDSREDKRLVHFITEHSSCASNTQRTLSEFATVAEIGNAYKDWVRDTKNEADPWVIAHAKEHGGGIITLEKMTIKPSPSNPRIPFVARTLYGIQSLDLFDYLRLVHKHF
ncbi:DUF4411 family protein [Bifidobacterium sp. ESL0745]|uniref:DUF4411 family protein n=1 Tax=Bifidobacterium sp. ESL0745 TaxID=2983226 RepID=UPI0023FA1DDB|nr:DUF4411 family protein [Bifidobacterium sp. ESL0745]MDF7665942.1 DUF4411 family protein [Bifidobacterium sp. ESL0745]